LHNERNGLGSRQPRGEVGESYKDFVAELASIRALNRINTVDDVAFLVSPGARSITGQSLNVVDAGLVWDGRGSYVNTTRRIWPNVGAVCGRQHVTRQLGVAAPFTET
jgi:hypothetical protein